jgi:hypothetical protein
MTPHRFDVEHRSNGSIVVRCGDLSADSERGLARRLVEEDRPDAPIEGGRPGKLDWTHRSLHRFAADGVAPREADQTPERLHPTLAAAVTALRAERRAAQAARAKASKKVL